MRLKGLQPILLKVKGMGSDEGVVDYLKELDECVVSYHIRWLLSDIILPSEIKSLTVAIEQAASRGLLVRFFDSTDDASSLKSHNDNLDRLIAKATVSPFVVHLYDHFLLCLQY